MSSERTTRSKRKRAVPSKSRPALTPLDVYSTEEMPLSFYLHTPPKKVSKRKGARNSKSPGSTLLGTSIVDIEDPPCMTDIVSKVDDKINAFFKSGSLLSSDEDEDVSSVIRRSHKATNSKVCDTGKVSEHTSSVIDDENTPSTSKAGPAHEKWNGKKSNEDTIETIDLSDPDEPSSSSSKIKSPAKVRRNSIDDIMAFVDRIAEPCSSSSAPDPITDIKSLEDYRKETEEMLKSANTFLDTLCTTKKPEEKKVESPKETSFCPVCFEPLSSKPAAATICGHIFCKGCIEQAARIIKKCPTCRKGISLKKIHPIYL